ncbi:recombination mediator RecR [Candidatus Woesebacteria bacterium]|nr:recombination mediator RecR [Candidatus Woesebacteria bacterium]MCD8507613.1 recombination mediator RecR [Candidatus Woesebacteria bacterium]MCD8526799.1 recombination mediator RecR [Candidatus Woesebacteria bacterium]MCD8545979.1 recombination mediator RecR [Candidatus Woesebacteria bacterium]
MKLPRSVQGLVEQFEKLPGIGPKSAQRLAFYLIHVPDYVVEDFSQALLNLKRNTRLCTQCHNIDEAELCLVCSDATREQSVLCVVENPLDVIALERTNTFKGLYHVLHGVIAPLDNIGPEQLYLRDILDRLDGVTEVILATNPTMEGEATALYIEKMIREAGYGPEEIAISRIGHGLPVGADIEYADGVTLSRALEGRRNL